MTWSTSDRFKKDFAELSERERTAFQLAAEKLAAEKMVDDMKNGGPFREGLRIKGVKGATGIFEVTWADDGRATFEYGTERRRGHTHIVWRRVGHHDIFGAPDTSKVAG